MGQILLSQIQSIIDCWPFWEMQQLNTRLVLCSAPLFTSAPLPKEKRRRAWFGFSDRQIQSIIDCWPFWEMQQLNTRLVLCSAPLFTSAPLPKEKRRRAWFGF